VKPELLAKNPLWLGNNQRTIVIDFHQDFVDSTHSDFFQVQTDGDLIQRPNYSVEACFFKQD
jgi:hypothetical protein